VKATVAPTVRRKIGRTTHQRLTMMWKRDRSSKGLCL
jgi:hypothetical protein